MALIGDYAPSPRDHVRNQVELYESSGGTAGTTMRGKPVVIVTSRGARTGKIRKTPLMRVEHEGSYGLVASQGGAPTHPTWYYNLEAHPDVEIQDGADRHVMRVHLATGAERETWWQRAVEAWPDYADYQTRTERQLPAFVAEPAE